MFVYVSVCLFIPTWPKVDNKDSIKYFSNFSKMVILTFTYSYHFFFWKEYEIFQITKTCLRNSIIYRQLTICCYDSRNIPIMKFPNAHTQKILLTITISRVLVRWVTISIYVVIYTKICKLHFCICVCVIVNAHLIKLLYKQKFKYGHICNCD